LDGSKPVLPWQLADLTSPHQCEAVHLQFVLAAGLAVVLAVVLAVAAAAVPFDLYMHSNLLVTYIHN
jgi:hypothetical protein